MYTHFTWTLLWRKTMQIKITIIIVVITSNGRIIVVETHWSGRKIVFFSLILFINVSQFSNFLFYTAIILMQSVFGLVCVFNPNFVWLNIRHTHSLTRSIHISRHLHAFMDVRSFRINLFHSVIQFNNSIGLDWSEVKWSDLTLLNGFEYPPLYLCICVSCHHATIIIRLNTFRSQVSSSNNA